MRRKVQRFEGLPWRFTDKRFTDHGSAGVFGDDLDWGQSVCSNSVGPLRRSLALYFWIEPSGQHIDIHPLF